MKNCIQCKKEYRKKTGQKYCSVSCFRVATKGKTRNRIAPSWAKGKKFSEEHKQKLSVAKLGKPRAGNPLKWKHSRETLEKLRISHLGQKAWNKGKKVPQMTGEKHFAWKAIKYPRYHHTTATLEYRTWRMSVFTRDNFKCRIADQNCKGQLEAHHILNWVDYLELRYAINNGITLCQAHHPRKRAEEKRLIPTFQELASVSKVQN